MSLLNFMVKLKRIKSIAIIRPYDFHEAENTDGITEFARNLANFGLIHQN